jgi:hypothetical protein
MNVVEFEDWLDRLGEDLSRWPETRRQAAFALLEGSAEARGLLEESVALRRALAAPMVRAPAGLADRIVALAPRSAAASVPVEKAWAGPGGPNDPLGEEIDASLSAAGAAIMRHAFANVRRRLTEHSATTRSSRDWLTMLLKADPFRPADDSAASQAASAKQDSDRARDDEEIATAIARLSPDDRRRLADLRQHHRPGGGPGLLP